MDIYLNLKVGAKLFNSLSRNEGWIIILYGGQIVYRITIPTKKETLLIQNALAKPVEVRSLSLGEVYSSQVVKVKSGKTLYTVFVDPATDYNFPAEGQDVGPWAYPTKLQRIRNRILKLFR